MTEFEFFAEYELVPSVVLPERVLHARRRNGGEYGTLNLIDGEYFVRVLTADNVDRYVGMRRSFAGAFKLLREQLIP